MIRAIPNFSRYGVDRIGNVFKLKTGLQLSSFATKEGYIRIRLFDDKGKRRGMLVHRLVALSFLPILKDRDEVNHLDGNKENNSISNLEWSDRSRNLKHAHKTGLICSLKGSKVGTSKYNEMQVLAILTCKDFNRNKIAESLNVPISFVKSIRSGRSWRHISRW